MSVKHITNRDPKTWYQHTDRQIFLGDVLEASNSDNMSVGFARFGKKGRSTNSPSPMTRFSS